MSQYPRSHRRPNWPKIVAAVVMIAVGLQVPLVWALGRLTAHPVWVVGFAAVLTFGFVASLAGPRKWSAPGRLRLYGLLWPFFIWWTASLIFAVLLPIGLLVSTLFALAFDTVAWACVALAAVGAAIALEQRPRLRAREVAIAGLPADFDGYRVAQISDLHCGPFAGETRVGRWVDAVNRLEVDMVAVTGDLIASGTSYVDTVATSLGRLRARDGVYACMGNHDYFTDGDHVAEALEGAGLTLLRNRGVTINRGDGAIFVAGVDDTWTRRHDLDRTLADRPPDTRVVLLAHDPALFPEAAARGVELTLSGHTHGGQVGVPFFAHRFNLAKVLTRFTTDLYRLESSFLYVNRGLGTTGPPVRLAVPPEIAIFTLRRA